MSKANRTRCLIALLCCGAGIAMLVKRSSLLAAAGTSAQDRVNAAYAAIGGNKLKTLTLKASLQQYDPGESYSVSDPEKPDTGISDLTQSRDLQREFARNEWVRPKADDGAKRTFTEIVTPSAGYVIGNDATNGRLPKRTVQGQQPQHTMSGRRLTATLRELERPFIVLEMKRHPDRVTAIDDQKVGGKTYPAAQYRDDYGTFIVMFDPATNLPARIRTMDWDALEGDSAYDAEYSDRRDVSGVKIAFRALYTLNGMKVADLKLTNAAVNPSIAPKTFEIPQAMLAAAAKPAPANATPFQWIIRRQFSGFYYDSDKKYTDDLDSLKLVDVATNISQTQGGTHNTLFIANNTYLIAVEAPNDDGQAIQSIEMAKKRYPGKPLRYLILTHHHVDHVGGMRTYAAEGATIVVAKGDGDYFRKALARPETLNPDAPQKAFTPKVIEAHGKWTVKDAGREVDAYQVANPHAEDMMIVYVPDAKLGIVTDLYTPGAPVSYNTEVAALAKGVEKLGIKPERFAGGHGSVGPYADVLAAMKNAQSSGR